MTARNMMLLWLILEPAALPASDNSKSKIDPKALIDLVNDQPVACDGDQVANSQTLQQLQSQLSQQQLALANAQAALQQAQAAMASWQALVALSSGYGAGDFGSVQGLAETSGGAKTQQLQQTALGLSQQYSANLSSAYNAIQTAYLTTYNLSGSGMETQAANAQGQTAYSTVAALNGYVVGPAHATSLATVQLPSPGYSVQTYTAYLGSPYAPAPQTLSQQVGAYLAPMTGGPTNPAYAPGGVAQIPPLAPGQPDFLTPYVTYFDVGTPTTTVYGRGAAIADNGLNAGILSAVFQAQVDQDNGTGIEGPVNVYADLSRVQVNQDGITQNWSNLVNSLQVLVQRLQDQVNATQGQINALTGTQTGDAGDSQPSLSANAGGCGGGSPVAGNSAGTSSPANSQTVASDDANVANDSVAAGGGADGGPGGSGN